MTPNDINVLLHYYASPHPHPQVAAPAVRDTLDMFVQQDVLDRVGVDTYNVTDRGSALVKMLMRVPLPRKAWVDEDGVEVIDI